MIGRSPGFLDSEASARNAVLVLIATTAVVRMVFAGSLGLGTDETYTVATSRVLQGGVFDHPPLAWWLTWMMRAVTGAEHPLAMRLPFVVAFALTTWFTYALTRLLYGLRSGFWAAVAVNIPPAIGWTSGTWVLPDGPLYAALTGGSYAVARVLFTPRASPMWWIVAGAAGGIAMLSKLHGLFLFAGTLVFLASSPRYRHWLASPWPYLGGLVALAMLTPTLIWNVQHDWIAFTFQAQRGEARRFDVVALLGLIGGQMVYLLPLVWLLLVAVWVGALRRGPANARDWLIVCLASGPILLFTSIGLWAHRAMPHWAMPGYLLLMPLLGREIARGLALAQRWVKPWLWLCIGTTALLVPSVIALAYLPWPTVRAGMSKPLMDPLVETTAWDEVQTELQRRGHLQGPRRAVVGTNWHHAARLDVALAGRVPVLCMATDPRGYGILVHTASYAGFDAIILSQDIPPDRLEVIYGKYFDALTREPDIVVTRAGKPTLTLIAYAARNLHAPPPGTTPNLLDPLGAWSGRITPVH